VGGAPSNGFDDNMGQDLFYSELDSSGALLTPQVALASSSRLEFGAASIAVDPVSGTAAVGWTQTDPLDSINKGFVTLISSQGVRQNTVKLQPDPGTPTTLPLLAWSDGKAVAVYWDGSETLNTTHGYIRTMDQMGNLLHERELGNRCRPYAFAQRSDAIIDLFCIPLTPNLGGPMELEQFSAADLSAVGSVIALSSPIGENYKSYYSRSWGVWWNGSSYVGVEQVPYGGESELALSTFSPGGLVTGSQVFPVPTVYPSLVSLQKVNGSLVLSWEDWEGMDLIPRHLIVVPAG
jgi:hypothetical protein